MSLLPSNVKYQLSDIRSCNQLSMKYKRCIFKQTCSFAGNILERIALAYGNELWQWVSLLGNIILHKRNRLESWLFRWFPSPA